MKVGLTVMKLFLTVGAKKVNTFTLNDLVLGEKD